MRVILAMSGGVDSTVSALLLKNQGYDVVGITFKNFDNNLLQPDSVKKGCCSLEMINRARDNCYRLGISHYVIDRVREFDRQVIEDFRLSYSMGLTPNPCVRCNALVRWPELIAMADRLGAEFVATGHYARIFKEHDGIFPARAIHKEKDQSYALWQLRPEYLARTLFPLGEMNKAEVEKIAIEHSLISSGYKESQDICFVPDGSYAGILGNDRPGEINDTNGVLLGYHKGVQHYTIGQRRGLGISSGQPLYVVEIDSVSNRVIVGRDSELYRNRMTVESTNWFGRTTVGDEFSCQAKIRYKHVPADCSVKITAADSAEVEFALPQRAITPGQSAVFYDGDRVLGGGVIRK